MTTKYLFFLSILLIMCSLTYGRRSFTIVTDTTGSMREEVEILRAHISSVVSNSMEMTAIFGNFILVPFSDPDVGIPKISTTPEGLVTFLNDMEVSGGNDCLENSMAALKKALEISKNNSIIVLFTDAPAKDIQNMTFVETLCRQRQSQVVIFLSGECPGVAAANIDVYSKIAKTCSGAVFHLDIQSFPHVLKYLKEIINVEWTNIHTHEEFMGTRQFNFNVDRYTKDVIVAVAGDYPVIHITNAQGESSTLEKIVDTKHAVVVRLMHPEVGEYEAEVCSRGQSHTTFYKWKTVEFRYGFSPIKPRSLLETSLTPLPDFTSYLIIELLDSDIELFLLEIQIEEEKRTLQMEVLDEARTLYMVQAYFKSNQSFRITIHCWEKKTYEVIIGTTKVINAQIKIPPRSIGATVEAIKLNSSVVEYMSSLNLYCKVSGEPKPDIWWEDENENIIDSKDFLFQWPSTYMSYATINNATVNTTIYCKGKNSEGESSLSANLYVHRDFTFEVLQNPSDTTIEYGNEGKLFCEAEAYPEASIKWYHNDSIVENSENVEIVYDENMLLIKTMTIEETGEYKCEVSNEIESRVFTAIVDISGLEAPSIEITETEFILQPGDSMEVDCAVKGTPIPSVTWRKLVDDEFVDIPEGFYVEGTVLKVPSAKAEHRGTYKCEATNVQGETSKEITIKVQYNPKIKHGDETVMVKAGELVELECDVDAEPKAVVHWEMYQGDVIIAFDHRHRTDDRYTHRFIAQPHDYGIYHCIAENEVGRAQRMVTVNVLETPYVEQLQFKTLTVRAGSSVNVPCNVLLGRPIPTTRWEFISPKSSTSVISRKTTTKLDLHLTNVSKANEGYYQCVAENEQAFDSIKFNLLVQH